MQLSHSLSLFLSQGLVSIVIVCRSYCSQSALTLCVAPVAATKSKKKWNSLPSAAADDDDDCGCVCLTTRIDNAEAIIVCRGCIQREYIEREKVAVVVVGAYYLSLFYCVQLEMGKTPFLSRSSSDVLTGRHGKYGYCLLPAFPFYS